MRLIILSGMSGAGKSIALNMLEDLGYYCVDNLPAALLGTFVDHTFKTREPTYERLAIGVDARNHAEDIATVPEAVRRIREEGQHCELIFLTAGEDVLLTRYSDTRRRHPLSSADMSLRDAIMHEAELLGPIRDAADLIIDTSRTNIHQLRDTVRDRVDPRTARSLSLLFQSFAYKNGVPRDADFVFDTRALPNPHWDLSLRQFSGRDEPVVAFLERQPPVQRMLSDLTGFLEYWIPEFERTNRSYLTVAVGCTGGQHRSVFVAEKLAQHFRERYTHVLSHHRQLTT